MYNANKPATSELPSTIQLLRSTVLALMVAVVILLTIILPAEYALDPTGAGRLLGLLEMGEIKTQLAKEAAADKLAVAEPVVAEPVVAEPVVAKPVVSGPPWRDEIRIILTPGQGAEVKLVMQQGETAVFSWVSVGGPVNFDLHGDASGRSISYEKGRGVSQAYGDLVAEFTGNHGWFFRNRNKREVTVVLSTRGAYAAMKRVL